jgi:hypothetical protein
MALTGETSGKLGGVSNPQYQATISALTGAAELNIGYAPAITNITDVPTTSAIGTLTLSGTLAGYNNKDVKEVNSKIVWSVKSAGTTGATISGDTLTTTAAGTVTVTATVARGTYDGTAYQNYTKDFTIAVAPAYKAVTGITNLPTDAVANKELKLSGTVAPADATNQTIVWSIGNAGETMAVITGDTFKARKAGYASVTATIVNGLTQNTDYTTSFNIHVGVSQDKADSTTMTLAIPANGTVIDQTDMHFPENIVTLTNNCEVSFCKRLTAGGKPASSIEADTNYSFICQILDKNYNLVKAADITAVNSTVEDYGNYLIVSFSSVPSVVPSPTPTPAPTAEPTASPASSYKEPDTAVKYRS